MEKSKTAFVFPGQASQYIGMGKDIAATYPEAAALFAQADEILKFPFSNLCWYGSTEELDRTFNTQPAIFVTSLACYAALRGAGYILEPDFVAGLSIGEYVAYTVSGALSFEDGLRLVRERGRLMEKAGQINPGQMAAILLLEDEKIAQICHQVSEETGWVQIANYNAPGQIIISGTPKGIKHALELTKSAGARRTMILPISIAAHSKLMGVVAEEYRTIVKATPLKPPSIPVVANTTGKPIYFPEAIRQEMVNQLTDSVQWIRSIQFLIEQGINQFIEIGPKKSVSGLIKRINRSVSTLSIEDSTEINKLLAKQLCVG